jgi:N-acetylglucosaminylphosphatidylinositol deacetylase
VPLIHKYLGPFAAVLGKADLAFASLLARAGLYAPQRMPVFVSGAGQYWTALRAMMQHRSQLVWFRWLYVSFSRYMWVNEWVRVVPPSQTVAGEAPAPKVPV